MKSPRTFLPLALTVSTLSSLTYAEESVPALSASTEPASAPPADGTDPAAEAKPAPSEPARVGAPEEAAFTEPNPPAERKMRPLATDRPDTTESPYTVDRGHFQAEIDVARYTLDAGVESYSFASSNLKMGITDFWEVQLVIDGLVGVPTATGHEWGSGSMDLRTKFNLLGNDGGAVAIGVMPWLTFPRVSMGEQVEGGMIGLLGIALPAEFATGFMLQADGVKNELDSDYHFELLHTWTVGHPIVGPLGAYVEAFGVYSSEAGADYVLSMDGGLTFAVTDYVQLDAGVVGGLTAPADDLSIFSGLSFKL
jgi:hypothetical protein